MSNEKTGLINSSLHADDRIIPPFLFSLIYTALEEQNLQTNELTINTNIETSDLSRTNTLITFNEAIVIIQNALRLSGNPSLGMEIGQKENLSDRGVLGYAILNCVNGLDAINFALSYYRLPTSLSNMAVENNRDKLFFKIDSLKNIPNDAFRFITEQALCGIATMMSELFGPSFTPIEVHFTFPQPDYAEHYRKYFPCPVIFEAEHNQLISRGEILYLYNPSYNPTSKRLADKLNFQSQLTTELPYLAKSVRSALLNSEIYFPAINEIADKLAMSESSLRRKLKTLGTSFQEILDNVREELSLRYLEETEFSMDKISELVGFSNSQTFYRAFKKWTGKAPSDFRQQSSIPTPKSVKTHIN